MAGAKPGVHALQLKPVSVHEELKTGGKFIKWDEDACSAPYPATLKVDPEGFFLYWTAIPSQETEVLDICLIRDTRFGKYAKQPKNTELIPTKGNEDSLLTIVYGTDLVNISFYNFIAYKEGTAKLWTDQLFTMATNVLSQNASRTTYLRKAHTKLRLQLNSEGKIPSKNIYKMFPDKKRVDQALDHSRVDKTTGIKPDDFTWDVFLKFLEKMCPRDDLQGILVECGSKKKPFITLDQFMTFINTKQRDPRLNEVLYPPLKIEQARQIMEHYEPNSCQLERDQISLKAFSDYLAGEENCIVPPEKLDLMDDMNQPLSHYFINSSHNTYLTVGQLTGASSVEMYRQVLLTGCRCIELDCWKSKTAEEEPYITHGFTMTTEIAFKDVIEAIAESAFKTSQYPVILSFENHVDSPKQQAKMAEYCRTIFGDALLIDPLEKFPLVRKQPLPSPQDMLGKILIKNKKEHPRIKPDARQMEALSPEEQAAILKELEPDSDEEEDEEQGSDNKKPSSDEGTASSEVIATAEMSTLVNYIQPVKFKNFDWATERERFYEMSSFVETKGLDALKNFPTEFLEYNKNQLSRIYPKGTRVDSSNYMPQLFWNVGCQMVALNFQTLDLPMQLNMGVFEYNGNSGYLLKPEFMRRTDKHFDPFTERIVDGIVANTFKITVISGQFLSEKKVGVYVEVDMFGLPSDTKRKNRTKMSTNSIDPVWKDETFIFHQVILPSLASVRIAVYEENNRFIGHRVLPVSAIRPGYHYICLKNELNQPLLLPSVLVYTEVQDYIPDEHQKYADALADPIRHVNQQKKREQQLEALMEEKVESKLNEMEKDVNVNTADLPTNPKKLRSPGPQSASPDIIPPAPVPKEDIIATVMIDLKFPSAEELKEHKSYDKLIKKHNKDYKDLQKKNLKKLQSEIQKKCSVIEKSFKRSLKKSESQDALQRDPSARNQTVQLQEQPMNELIQLRTELFTTERQMQQEHLKEAYKKLKELASESLSTRMKKMPDTCEKEKKELQKMQDRKRQNSIIEAKSRDKDLDLNDINMRHIKDSVTSIRNLENEQERRVDRLKHSQKELLQHLEEEFRQVQAELENKLELQYQQIREEITMLLPSELQNKGVQNKALVSSLSNHSSPSSGSLSNCSTPTFQANPHRWSAKKMDNSVTSPSEAEISFS